MDQELTLQNDRDYKSYIHVYSDYSSALLNSTVTVRVLSIFAFCTCGRLEDVQYWPIHLKIGRLQISIILIHVHDIVSNTESSE